MFKKEKIGYLFASGGFFLASILGFVGKNFILGFSFASMGFVFLGSSAISRKSKELDYEFVECDKLFQEFIKEENTIKAIKRCRVISNCSLKDASDYVNRKMEVQ